VLNKRLLIVYDQYPCLPLRHRHTVRVACGAGDAVNALTTGKRGIHFPDGGIHFEWRVESVPSFIRDFPKQVLLHQWVKHGYTGVLE
jgi:hypothetical protein